MLQHTNFQLTYSPILVTFLLIFSGQSVWSNQYPLPDGMCTKTNNSLNQSDSVKPIEYGSCQFTHSLCNYTQGCTDKSDVVWRANESFVNCVGNNGQLLVFSVLLSPLLDIQHVSCLSYEYSYLFPGRLSVFLANTSHVIHLIDENTSQVPNFASIQEDLPQSKFAVGFRAREPMGNEVKLRNVIIQYGSCSPKSCNFDEHSFCGWTNDAWILTNASTLTSKSKPLSEIAGFVAQLDTQSSQGSLTTGLTRATNHTSKCVRLHYVVDGVNAKLTIYVKPLNRPQQTILEITSNFTHPSKWGNITFPVTTTEAYEITFFGSGCAGKSIVAIDNVYTKDERCVLGYSEVNFNLTRQLEWACDPAIGHTSTFNTSYVQKMESNDSVAIIAGSCASVVIILAVVLGIFFWIRRKHHSNRSSSKGEDHGLVIQKQHSAFIINTERNVTNSVFSVNAERDQHNVFRKGGSVLKIESTDSSIMETNRKPYTVMNTADINTHTYDLIPGDRTSEMVLGDDSVRKFSWEVETVSNDPLTSPNNKNELTTSAVDKDDKGNNARSLGQIEQLNCPDVYSKVRKNVKKPVNNEEYNRLDALKPKAGNFKDDTIMNTYNELNLAINPVRNTQINECNNGTIKSSQNEYNVLNLQQKKCNNVADARHKPSDNCDSKQNIYSSADIHTDTYSRVQNDKKERVINSDYDHIR